jgi:hypothetical protein
MTTCLLCPSPAVAELLCVPCGAKLWAARLWVKDPETVTMWVTGDIPRNLGKLPDNLRGIALRELSRPTAMDFLAQYDAARATHEARNKEFDRKDER